MPRDYEFEERAGIMEFDGGLDRHEAERLVRTRPWEQDRTWGFPRAEQMTLGDDAPEWKRQLDDFYRKR